MGYRSPAESRLKRSWGIPKNRTLALAKTQKRTFGPWAPADFPSGARLETALWSGLEFQAAYRGPIRMCVPVSVP
jgi:hypothetical protein